MNHHDLDWLTAQRPDEPAYDPAARERALAALRQHTRPARRRRGLGLRGVAHARAVGVAAVGAAAAVTAVVMLSAGGGTHVLVTSTAATRPAAHHHAVAHHAGAVHSRLARLADYVSASATPPGDATLVARTTTTGGQTVTVYDLYADNGKYYFSPVASGLAGQVSAGHNLAGGLFAREVAAAKLAATGNVQTATQDMADAADPSKVISPHEKTDSAALAAKAAATGVPQLGNRYDNWVWEDSQDAIIAGSGQPEVRAGVLQILATLPGVTVTNGTSNGEPTLVLTAGAPEMGADYTEQLTIDAHTGVPIQFVGGPPNGAPATTVTYKVSRVTLSDLSAGTGTTD